MVYLSHWPIPDTLGNRQINFETVFARMDIVLAKLQNPQHKLPPVIHVAGTNGKGSTVALIAKIFACAGYKTHIYTSPHLHECNERIVLAGEKISDSFLFEIMEETRIAVNQASDIVPLTFMEGFTIGALLAFSKVPADVLIIECGMGGRIDATNIIDEKIATVITPISFDHTEYLGNSIERIALEKALIMRPKTPLIVAAQLQKARNIIEILAADQNIPVYFYERDFEVILDEKNSNFDFRFGDKILKNLPKPALAGFHQYINFAAAIAAILAIGDKFCINEGNLRQAIATVYWPSRLEKITNNFNKIFKNSAIETSGKISSGISSGISGEISGEISSEIWIDGAHNESGALYLARWIISQNHDQKKNFIICGFSRNKCKKEFLEKFKNIATIIAVRVDGEPYPEDPKIITEIGALAQIKILPFADLLEAIFWIAQNNNYQPCRIVICGSLHLARDVRKFSNTISHLKLRL
jgi:dihydrofolate synthase/folylpolyglutamate synthase